MISRFVNQANSNVDLWFSYTSWLGSFNINHYQVVVMIFNLLLLLIPWLLAKYLAKLINKKFWLSKIWAIIIFGIWVIFIPNTAYLISGIRHLFNYCPVGSAYHVCVANAWMIMVFFIYSLVGWLSYVYLVRQMATLLKKRFSAKFSQMFVIVLIPLISLAILLGLLNRWNSWEIALYPGAILTSIGAYFTDWAYFTDFAVFTAGLFGLYWLGSRLLVKSSKIQDPITKKVPRPKTQRK